jgi:FHS family L-fucose permease-like MFS transporter
MVIKNKLHQALPLMAIFSLFFLWALAHNLNPILIPHLKNACKLSDMQSALVDSSFYIAYFFMALPAGFIIKRYGYQSTIVLGLSLFSMGAFVFYPAATLVSYPLFLLALFIIATGITFLETAANPYVSILGAPETASQRLNFAQAFNGLGATLAALFGSKFILSDNSGSALSVRIPYLIIGCLVLLVMLVFFRLRLPKAPEDKTSGNQDFSLKRLMSYPQFKNALVAQFFYVGAQVGIGSFFIRYCVAQTQIENEEAALYLSAALLLFMIGRFLGAALLKVISTKKLLFIYGVVNMVLLWLVIIGNGISSVYALMATQFFMSIMFPSIFAIGIKGLGSDTRFASPLLIMTIVGGAILPLAMGSISDNSQINNAFIIPFICFGVIAWFAYNLPKEKLS